MSSLLRGPSAAAGVIAASVGGALTLMPAGTVWPNLSLADVLASPDILDWAKGSLGLILMLRRGLGKTNGG